MNFSMSKESLFAAITDAVRQGCKDQGIKQGAIAVCFEPSIGAAHHWLGIPHSSESVTFIAAVNPEYGTIYLDEDGKEVGDCAGVTMMKICAAKRAIMCNCKDHFVSKKEESTSGAMPEKYVGNGRINWKGCVAVSVGYKTGGYCCCAGTEAMIIYVAVSGGKQDQDEAAAWYCLDVLRKDFDCVDGFMLRRDYREQPTENADSAPNEE